MFVLISYKLQPVKKTVWTEKIEVSGKKVNFSHKRTEKQKENLNISNVCMYKTFLVSNIKVFCSPDFKCI